MMVEKKILQNLYNLRFSNMYHELQKLRLKLLAFLKVD
jgi:hypothetical protein